MDKRAIVFLGIGILCAGVVVFVAQQFLSKSDEESNTVPGVKVLVAAKDLHYGTAVEFEREGEPGNVGFMRWPKEFVPKSAITDPEKVKKKDLVVLGSFVRYEPILKEQVMEQKDFIPDDMLPRRISVDPQDVKEGLLEAGMRVDIYRDYEEFMRSVRICSVGELKYNKKEDKSDNKKKKKQPPKYVYVLIKHEHMVEFEKARDHGDLQLFPAGKDAEDEPVLVSELSTAKTKAAGKLLENGASLVAQGDFEKALKRFKTLTEKYPDQAPAVQEANRWLGTCRRLLAEQLYVEAQAALIEEDYAGCQRLVQSLQQKYSQATDVLARAEELQKMAEQRGQHQQYISLLDDIRKSLDGGNLPRAQKLLEERLLKEFVETGYKAQDNVLPPQQALNTFRDELRRRQSVFSRDQRVYDALRRSGNGVGAARKFQEMAQRFPDHPFVTEKLSQAKN